MTEQDLADLKQQLGRAQTAELFFTDLNGRLKSLAINPENIEAVLRDGVGIDGSSIAGLATVDDSDRIVKPVPESFRLIEFADRAAGFFAGRIFNQDGSRSPLDPRYALERAVDRGEREFQVRFTLGPEHEFFLLNPAATGAQLHTDGLGYNDASPADPGNLIRQEIVEVLAGCGIRYEKTHHEVTSSQHEINLEPGDPLAIADRCLLFEFVAKTVAARHGLQATFMSKPFSGCNRNAFHVHLSVSDLQGNNLGHAAAEEHQLSGLLKHFIGGIVRHARETSLVMASTVNSYKAYVLDKEAPVVRGWGVRNRSSMVRIPHAAAPSATRLELRSPDAAGNVYLQFAVLVAMGLDGLREQDDPGDPDLGSAYRQEFDGGVNDPRFLPRDFFPALLDAESSDFLKETLGSQLFDNYLGLKIAEWETHRTTITDLERRMYLPI